ncbi:MAG TPA: major capsid protein [Thermoguttaceae bacterium]|nr:major capsid protein [Thermoguttaceae bacterium]
MATITYDEIMSSAVVTRAISQLRGPNMRFQRFFGCLPGGANVEQVPGHSFVYDIFDKTRTLAKGRAPGAGPATSTPQIIGQVSAQIYRSHEKVMLQDERVFRRRPIGGQWGEVDVAGQRYVTAQEGFIAQRFSNSREFMLSRMFRGGFGLLRSGDDWILVEKGGGTFDIDYQIPAGNLTELLMVDLNGDTIVPAAFNANFKVFDTATATMKWSDTANAPIIGQLLQINRCFQIQHGWPLRHIWLNSSTYQWVLNNTGLKNAAGSANIVFNEMIMSTADDGKPDGGFDVVFKPLPQFIFHVYDGVLEVNGSTSATIPDNKAIFCTEPDMSWVSMVEGSELVRENLMADPHEESGIYAWTERKTQPGGSELIAVDNVIPALYVPRCVAYANVNF